MPILSESISIRIIDIGVLTTKTVLSLYMASTVDLYQLGLGATSQGLRVTGYGTFCPKFYPLI